MSRIIDSSLEREVGSISTLWMTDGTLSQYFGAAARLFPSQKKASWDQLVGWLKSPQSEEYQIQVRCGLDRVRTGGSWESGGILLPTAE